MSDRTPAKDEADQILDAAIQRWAEAYELVDDGHVITDYVVGLAAQRFDQPPHRALYAWGSRHDAMPLHSVLGLIDVTREAALASSDVDDD